MIRNFKTSKYFLPTLFILVLFLNSIFLSKHNYHRTDFVYGKKAQENIQNELIVNNPIMRIDFEDIFYDNSKIYCTYFGSSIRIFDVSNPKKTYLESRRDLDYANNYDFELWETTKIYNIKNNLAFAYMYNETGLFLKCYNITTEEVNIVSSFSYSSNASAIDTGYYDEQNKLLYLITRFQIYENMSIVETRHDMLAFNLTDFFLPQLIDRYSIDTDITKYKLFHYEKPYAYLMKEHFLEIREIVNSSFSQVHYTEELYGITTTYFYGPIGRINVKSNLLSFSSITGNYFFMLDITERNNPVMLNSAITKNFNGSFFYQDIVFFLGVNTFSIFNVTTNNEFIFNSEVNVIGQIEGHFTNCLIKDNLLFLSKFTTSNKASLYIYDISDLFKPKKLFPKGLIFGSSSKSERYRFLFYTSVIGLPIILSIITILLYKRRKNRVQK